MAGTRRRGPWGVPGICCFLGSLLIGLLSPRAVAFNLDVMGSLRKEGEPGSLFGFSVALHRQLQPRPQSWLLVGAPQALALPGQQANRTGGLFACPLSLEETDCYRLDIDRGADVQKESKENQWLGVSVRSQGPGGKIVTCAHRYESRQRVDQILETRDVIGRCFVLSQDLGIRDELDGGEWKFCEGRPQGHEQFGFCQQGTAAAFSPDSHYLLFGAPGTFNWKGELPLKEGRKGLRPRRWHGVGGQHLARHGHKFMEPWALPCLPPPPPCCSHTHTDGGTASPLHGQGPRPPACWHGSPHARRGLARSHVAPPPHHCHSCLCTLPLAELSLGTARVELCVQGSADLAHLDDGPYEAGGEKDQDPRLIPVPANSYFGRDPSLARVSNPLLLLFLPLHTSPPPVSVSRLCLCL